jgi:sterol 24-C-methyltransferase
MGLQSAAPRKPAGGKFARPPSSFGSLVGAAVASLLVLGFILLLGVWNASLAFVVVAVVTVVIRALGDSDDQSIASFLTVAWQYRNVDFPTFLKSHNEAFLKGSSTGDYVPGVCNYYELMSELITVSSGPFWHFVPMTQGRSRKQCHEQFHHTVSDHLHAKESDTILEFGCGYGEIGRQVASISGANVTGLTMADAEIAGGIERIEKAGLQDRCNMVQGNYHNMPFDDCSFDKVFGVYTLKYSSDLNLAISEAARVLKPGGRLLSYEIITTDKYDPTDKKQKEMVHNISYSTCMPPLWHAQAFRDAATKAGLVPKEEVDLCAPDNEDPWYSCFLKTGVYYILISSVTSKLVGLAEMLRVVPKGFRQFYDTCLVHPAVDFVDAGHAGIIDGAIVMVWEKK